MEVWTDGGCNSYYLDPKTGRNIAIWPGFTFHFRWITRAFDVGSYRTRPMAEVAVQAGRDTAAERVASL